MKLYVYGEDGLTLWTLKNRLPDILGELNDPSNPSDCELFYRPSFGRRGGPNSSQFGEFDFIILAKEFLYLGESKWDGNTKLTKDKTINLRREQRTRHKLFTFYVQEFFGGSRDDSWDEFVEKVKVRSPKPLPKPGTLLSDNLRAILTIMKEHFVVCPTIENVLLYLHAGSKLVPDKVNNDFIMVSIEYPVEKTGNYIALEI